MKPTITCYGANASVYLFCLFFTFSSLDLFGQVYPPDATMTNGNYNPPASLPNYLEPFIEENFGNKVTRISSLEDFQGDTNNLRHEYSLTQPWNADGTKIQLWKNGNSFILDGNTYEIIDGPIDVERRWTNTDPDLTYWMTGGTRLVTTNVVTQTTTEHFDFADSGYTEIHVDAANFQLSFDDEKIGFKGRKGSQQYAGVYNFQTNIIEAELAVPEEPDDIHLSLDKQYIVLGNGSGSPPMNGTNVYKITGSTLVWERQVRSSHGHSDVGVDIFGEQIVAINQGSFVKTYRLSDGLQRDYTLAGGGHVSTRNQQFRPGWMYVSDRDYLEVYAIKLDDKPNGVVTVNRFTKHYQENDLSYNHEPHACPNRDGTKVMFASAMEHAPTEAQSYPFAWVVEVNEPTTGNSNAGQDETICNGGFASLSASGADSYVWSTGETTASIDVSPNITTIYSVTGTHSDGSTTTDEVTVFVNPLPTANAGSDETICQGSNVTLSASGGDSYLWSTGQTTQNITVSPNVQTPYTVTVFQNNCEDSDDMIVFVNSSPNVDAGNDVSILEGQSATLTANGGDTYLWSTGETTESIIVSPLITTTYDVTAFINGCEATDDVTVNVSANVTANAGEDVTICEGQSTVLTATGGDNYEWSTGETTQSINVNPISDTNYSVIVSIGNNSDTANVNVFVNSIPIAIAGNDVEILLGESTTLTASGGGSYEWSTGETTQSITVNPNVTTTYTVFVTQNNCEDFDDVVVTVNEPANANAGEDVSICEGGDGTVLTATGGDDYLWSTGETTQSITVNPTATSNYTVIVSNAFSSDTDDVTVVVNPLPNVQVSGDVTIMPGEFITISASGANNYEWNNGATQPNIAVSPSVTTTYTVTGYINNCSETESVVVSVVEVVTANAGEDQTICLGDNITLVASGGENYLWNTGETSQSIDVSPDEETTYTVIVSNEFDSDAAEVTVFVENCEIEEPVEEPEYQYNIFTNSSNHEIFIVKLSGIEGASKLYIQDIGGKLINIINIEDTDGQPIEIPINTTFLSKGVYIFTLKEQRKTTPKKIVVR